MKEVRPVTHVVYGDILFIINTYVTYALLRVTSLVCKAPASRLRTVAASLLGGAFSFLVLLRGVPEAVIALLRLLFAALLLFVTYYPFEKKKLLKLLGGFFLVNFVFAGLMFALWLFVSPKSMLFCAGVIYFDIDALTLVVLTAACYAFLSVANLLLRSKAPKGTLFELEITLGEKRYSCRALLDTGNSLYEPFSSFPVIVAEKRLFGDGFQIPEERLRLVPCSSVSSQSVLRAFRPDNVVIKGIEGETSTDKLYIGLTENGIGNSEFGALLHPDLTENMKERKQDYAFKSET